MIDRGRLTRLLVVDDEPHLLRALVMNLTQRGYAVTTSSTAALAMAQIRRQQPDLLLLDLGLPDRDGTDVIREVRSRAPLVPIVVLSARNGSYDKVTALELGAVDYVTKPFDVDELVARIRAAVRRVDLDGGSVRVTVGAVDVDLSARIARHADGTDIRFTPTEWRILDVLLRHPGRLVTGRELLTAVRGDPDHTESSYLRIYLAQLRRKLEPEPSRPRYLITESGMGYRFQPAPETRRDRPELGEHWGAGDAG
jgi:two-component system KDP operon response regulator KdpE